MRLRNIYFRFMKTIPYNLFYLLLKVNTFVLFTCILFCSCMPSTNIHSSWKQTIKNDTLLKNAHTGIAVMDAETGKYLFKQQSDRYFTPASNTKIFTLYAAMKYLGDSIPSFTYINTSDTLFIQPLGDPTFLHPDFSSQPAIEFMRKADKPVAVLNQGWETTAWGSGWAWSDFDAYYMPERSLFPVYGNCIRWTQTKLETKPFDNKPELINAFPSYPFDVIIKHESAKKMVVDRSLHENIFTIMPGADTLISVDIPFITSGIETALKLLGPNFTTTNSSVTPNKTFYSVSVDSTLRRMMFVSDNFLAEQLLLQTSMKRFGVMNEETIIDSLLNNELKMLPHPPEWVDGSGLSRYNLFTPEDFVVLLNQMRNEFGMERLKELFPTGNKGTLRRYYTEEEGAIFAKTGTLSGVVCLSGYLYTKKNRLFVFSVLVNQHRHSAASVRRTVERFLRSVRNNN